MRKYILNNDDLNIHDQIGIRQAMKGLLWRNDKKFKIVIV